MCISLPEYGRLARDAVPSRALEALQAFDEQHARRTGDTVFDWGFRTHVRAKNYVGVVQVPGLTLELLPKVDRRHAETERLTGDARDLAQSNLLYMLSVAGELPLQKRDLAGLRLRRFKMLDALIHVFSERLLVELTRGIERAYLVRESNERFVKGKILLPEHIRRNFVHKERAYVQYDEFSADTLTNQILRATCEILLRSTTSTATQRNLRTALIHLGDVSLEVIHAYHFDRLHYTRSTMRFKTLLEFCRLVITGRTPLPGAGSQETFSLLFPMERVFEGFVGNYLRRNAAALGLRGSGVRLQSLGTPTHLLQREDGGHRFLLKPDILVHGVGGSVACILDTKWKLLTSGVEDTQRGVSQADLYQLFAYAIRFDCPMNVLLFPRIPGVPLKNKTYYTEDEQRRTLRVAFIDVSSDLLRSQQSLSASLCSALGTAGELPYAVDA